MMIYLDTHVVVWLYLGDSVRFSEVAKKAIDEHDLLISPLIALELTYLHEIGRLSVQANQIIDFLSSTVGLAVCNMPLQQIINKAIAETWTRDPFDRLIVGHAACRNLALVTKDRIILDNYSQAIW